MSMGSPLLSRLGTCRRSFQIENHLPKLPEESGRYAQEIKCLGGLLWKRIAWGLPVARCVKVVPTPGASRLGLAAIGSPSQSLLCDTRLSSKRWHPVSADAFLLKVGARPREKGFCEPSEMRPVLIKDLSVAARSS